MSVKRAAAGGVGGFGRRYWASAAVCPAVWIAAPAAGQSLFLLAPPPMVNAEGQPDQLAELRVTSMFFVQPPTPKTFKIHDIVSIIIDENTRASSQQTLETTKELQLQSRVNGLVDPLELLELRLRQGDINNLTLADVDHQNEFTGEGQYDRTDRISARVAARVIDVKPNGTLVLEATKDVGTDEERRIVKLSGLARQEDITDANTVLSSQMADLRVEMLHEGELRKSSKKGLITGVLDALFNF